VVKFIDRNTGTVRLWGEEKGELVLADIVLVLQEKSVLETCTTVKCTVKMVMMVNFIVF
jgi:hypothetical protein